MKTFLVPKGTIGILAKRQDTNNEVHFSCKPWSARKDVVVGRENILTDPVSVHNDNDNPDESALIQLANPTTDTVIRLGDYYFITQYSKIQMI